jgi:hypothetical protein
MKFAAYTEDSIWAIADTEAEARAEGEAAIKESEEDAEALGALKTAPIDEDLVEAIAEAETTGEEVLFDLIDGELCEVEPVDAD